MDSNTCLFVAGTVATVAGAAAAAGWRAHGHAPDGKSPDSESRRQLLVALALAPGVAIGATDRSEPSAEPVLTRIRLHNTSRNVQAAGFVSPMFGLSVRQGDIPTGQYPQFALPDGRACPATLWGATSWPDGSLKFCSAMVRVGADIPARGTLDVMVRRGNARPSDSRLGLEELALSGLAVELTGVAGLEGIWTAELAQGIRTRSAVVQLGNGDAGAVWRIGADFRDTQGKAHGQLYCWHYVAALQDDAGRLLGLRHLGRVAQPWTDVPTPAPRHRDVKARLLAGQTELRRLQGHVDSEAPTDVIRLPHYASFFTAGEDARWDYVQAAGVAADDCTVRISLDPAYLVSTRLVPPYDLRGYVRYANDVGYHPMGRGTILRGMGTTGERADIGVLPEWNVHHLISQDPTYERVARVNAMASAGWRLTMRKRATGQPIPCADIKPQYAGLGPTEVNWRGYIYATGLVKPEPNESLWKEDTGHRPGCVYWPYLFTGEPQYLDLMVEQGFAHVLELAVGGSTYATQAPISKLYADGWKGNRAVRIGSAGADHPGAGVLFNGSGGTRIPAWASRDVAQAAAMAPDTAADGAAVRDYLRDVMLEAYAALSDYARLMPSTFTSAGMFVLGDKNESPWARAYLSWSICHQADVLATTQAVSAREYLSRFWRAYAAVADIGGMTAYRCSFWTDKGMVERIEDVVSMRQGLVSFKASTSRGTIVHELGKPALAWGPTDGDMFMFGAVELSPALPAPGIRAGQRLHAINCEGTSFQLSYTPGGPPIRIPADVDISTYMCRAKNLAPALQFNGSPHAPPANLRGAIAYHHMRGDDVGLALQGLNRIVDDQRIKFDDRNKYLVVSR
jgi:hypothetical protein